MYSKNEYAAILRRMKHMFASVLYLANLCPKKILKEKK